MDIGHVPAGPVVEARVWPERGTVSAECDSVEVTIIEFPSISRNRIL